MNLSTPQCSSGQSQSRPFPARPVKIMESAGHYAQKNVAGDSGGIAEKQNAVDMLRQSPSISKSTHEIEFAQFKASGGSPFAEFQKLIDHVTKFKK